MNDHICKGPVAYRRMMTMKIYLDNAASTSLDREVLATMEPFLTGCYGNPSSRHWKGREVRLAVESARKTIAGLLGAAPGDILFTSGGTEADNTAILSAIRGASVTRVISSPLEHHAVLNTLEALSLAGEIELILLSHDSKGNLDYAYLDALLRQGPKTLVSLMHGNNEVATVNNIVLAAEMCREYSALFHSDTVQTVGHLPLNMNTLNADFIVGSAHKLHGPKGVGFLCRGNKRRLNPLIRGGSQEYGSRAGTENVSGIVGMAKALELACAGMEEHHSGIQKLKTRMIGNLIENLPDVRFNGDCKNPDSLYTVLSISLPKLKGGVGLLDQLDGRYIAASGGSACNSNSNSGSHVINALGFDPEREYIRFSFSRYTTIQEIDVTVQSLKEIYHSVFQ